MLLHGRQYQILSAVDETRKVSSYLLLYELFDHFVQSKTVATTLGPALKA